MSETTLAKPLSGTEIIESIIYDFRYALLRDARLASHLAFNGYMCHGSLQIRFLRAATEGFDRPLLSERGSQALMDVPVEELETVEVAIERPDAQPPNQVRMETEQPVPVQVTHADGSVTEELKSYAGRDHKGRFIPPPRPKRGVLEHEAAAKAMAVTDVPSAGVETDAK